MTTEQGLLHASQSSSFPKGGLMAVVHFLFLHCMEDGRGGDRGTWVDFSSKFFFPRGATPGLETSKHSGNRLGSGSVQHLIRIPYQGSTPVQGSGEGRS